MEPFTKLTAVAAPIDIPNVDTDMIIPARFLRRQRGSGYGGFAFYDIRYDSEGNEREDFILNKPPYRNAKILIAGANFGCGSSREGAVYALYDFGIRAVIASSFGDIHYANELQNGMLPIVLPEAVVQGLRRQLHERPGAQMSIDLQAQRVSDSADKAFHFDIDPIYKERLLKGLDDIALVMQNIGEIEAYEQRRREQMPWLAESSQI